MTKERKIEILKDLLIQLSDSANILCTCEADERCEVIEEYIKALEQQPCEDWYDVPSEEMTLEQAKQAVKDLRKKLVEQQPCEDCENNDGECCRLLFSQSFDKSEIPTSDDCVSRQAIIDMTGLSNWFESSDDYCNFVHEISQLPPVTPTQSWIPVSERPPKDLEPVNTLPESYKAENKTEQTNKSLCDSCITKGCIFQSGIVRNHCDFYKAESED